MKLLGVTLTWNPGAEQKKPSTLIKKSELYFQMPHEELVICD